MRILLQAMVLLLLSLSALSCGATDDSPREAPEQPELSGNEPVVQESTAE